MNLATAEPQAIIRKSRSLIERTQSDLEQIDEWHFPTDSSRRGVELLQKTLNQLASAANLGPVEPVAFYNGLIEFQELVALVERSASDRISWPLVSYCDDIWRVLFGTKGPQLFYSLTGEHNYHMVRFIGRLRRLLEGVLAPSAIAHLTTGPELYCLQLPSTEDDNLPLYANIGHEFGHALWAHRATELDQLLGVHLSAVLETVRTDLRKLGEDRTAGRHDRAVRATSQIATELFCDLVGLALMGPAFLLSLYEFTWGQRASTWTVVLNPDARRSSAYPSLRLRLRLLREQQSLQSFLAQADQDFGGLADGKLAECLRVFGVVAAPDDADQLTVAPSWDPDAVPIRQSLMGQLPAVKLALRSFLAACGPLLQQWSASAERAPLSAPAVSALLSRLEHHIVPNIVPDGTLLGQPASFPTILTAAAIYRFHLLTSEAATEGEALGKQLRLAERLTAKALEVSFVQSKFNARGKDAHRSWGC